jgi:hypothetical protein
MQASEVHQDCMHRHTSRSRMSRCRRSRAVCDMFVQDCGHCCMAGRQLIDAASVLLCWRRHVQLLTGCQQIASTVAAVVVL